MSQTLQPPQVPAAPAAPADPAAPAVPRTAAQVAALQARTTELRNQLARTADLRDQVVRDLRQGNGGPGLTQFLLSVDAQVAELRSDVARNEQLLAAAPSGGAGTVHPRREFLLLGPNGPSLNAVPVLLFLVLALQVLLLRRGRSRHRDAPASEALLRETAARLARVEQAVDAIAVEVERVSEGQRFVSRLVGEQNAHAARVATFPRPQHQTPA